MAETYAKELVGYVHAHEEWRTKKTLNLISSETFTSPEARRLLSSDLSNRYSAPDNFYRGTKYADQIEVLAVEIAKKLYRCKFASVKSLSGHSCSLITFMSLLRPGDKIVTCPPAQGGYPGSSELGLGPLLSLKNLYFPYDPGVMNIIPGATQDLLEKETPQMTVFGSSFIPFPYEIEKSIPDGYSGYKVYDGSHVMGLIAAGEFQDPLREGCSILMGSTHKTLPGPQGGLILSSDEEVFRKVEQKIFPGIVDNIHLNRVASLTYAMAELLKFGSKYAKQVIRNARALASSLSDLDILVKCGKLGYTKSHQVILGYNEKESIRIANLLEELDVITDVGIRLGTTEVTRRGMRESEMGIIASIISDAIKKKGSRGAIIRRVHGLVKEFEGFEFTLS